MSFSAPAPVIANKGTSETNFVRAWNRPLVLIELRKLPLLAQELVEFLVLGSLPLPTKRVTNRSEITRSSKPFSYVPSLEFSRRLVIELPSKLIAARFQHGVSGSAWRQRNGNTLRKKQRVTTRGVEEHVAVT